MKKLIFPIVACVVASLGFLVWRTCSSDVTPEAEPAAPSGARLIAEADPSAASAGETVADASAAEAESSEASEEPAEEEPELTEEEKAAAEEEKRVEAFDALTDKWLEPVKAGVQMADISKFVNQFKAVPTARQDECLHRALNLIPDDNVMLLAGILLDTSLEKDLIETVYNDILNRDEEVKKPILREIFKDKSHPCWADTAWILDVTGELPQKAE